MTSTFDDSSTRRLTLTPGWLSAAAKELGPLIAEYHSAAAAETTGAYPVTAGALAAAIRSPGPPSPANAMWRSLEQLGAVLNAIGGAPMLKALSDRLEDDLDVTYSETLHRAWTGLN